MTSRRECHDDVTVMRSPKRILRDGHRMTTLSNTVQAVEKPSNAPQSLNGGEPEVATPVSTAEGENTLDYLGDRPVSEVRPALKIRLNQYRSQALVKITVRAQFASIPGVVYSTVVALLGDPGRAASSSPVTKYLSVIRTVANQSVVRAFRSSAS